MGYVIVGNCIAAVGAIEGIRRHDKETPITVVSKETYPAYGRPLIANYLKGKLSQEALSLRSPDFYSQYNVNVLSGCSATRVSAVKSSVEIEKGDPISYERLLIATGGDPILPPITGLEGPDTYTFVTLDDAKTLRKEIGRLKNIVVIGGGLIGLKAAESLHDVGVQVTIVELSDRILSLAFDRIAGFIIAKRLEEIGIQIATGTTVVEVLRHRDGRINGVRLQDGSIQSCDAVVAAVGVKPNIRLVEKTEIQTGRGILVDEYMETNVKGIFAAGDVAEARDWHFSEWRVVPIWPNAYRQGMVAGRNITGAGISFSGSIPMNSIAFYGIPTISVGVTNPPEGAGYEVIERINEEEKSYRKLVLKDNVLVGYVVVGRVERAGILTSLVREKREVGTFRDALLKEDIALLDLPKQIRKEKFGLPSQDVPFGVRPS